MVWIMKITQEHYDHMYRVMMDYSKTPLLSSYTKSGLTEKQWRWDWAIKAGLIKWICDNLYPYMNDDNIDTALRKITKG